MGANKPMLLRDIISKEDLQDAKEIRDTIREVNNLIGKALNELRCVYLFFGTGENKDKFNSIIERLGDLEGSLLISRNKSSKSLDYVNRVVESLKRELKEDE